jgi:hypothetical protein
MSNYVIIAREHMRQFLTERFFAAIDLPNIKELVYGKVIAHNVCLRVYTSIPKDGSISREVGRDAIRLLVMKRLTDGRVIPAMKKSKKVYRVEGWRENLQKRIDELTKEYGEYRNG